MPQFAFVDEITYWRVYVTDNWESCVKVKANAVGSSFGDTQSVGISISQL